MRGHLKGLVEMSYYRDLTKYRKKYGKKINYIKKNYIERNIFEGDNIIKIYGSAEDFKNIFYQRLKYY